MFDFIEQGFVNFMTIYLLNDKVIKTINVKTHKQLYGREYEWFANTQNCIQVTYGGPLNPLNYNFVLGYSINTLDRDMEDYRIKCLTGEWRKHNV